MASVDVLVCVKASLDESAASSVMGGLRALPGVSDVRIDGRRQRMMLVRYDPDRVKSSRLLDTVRGMGHDGRLVGA